MYTVSLNCTLNASLQTNSRNFTSGNLRNKAGNVLNSAAAMKLIKGVVHHFEKLQFSILPVVKMRNFSIYPGQCHRHVNLKK
jgi:hypothetical protein